MTSRRPWTPLRLAVIGRDGGSEIVLPDMRSLIDVDAADGFTTVLRGRTGRSKSWISAVDGHRPRSSRVSPSR